MLVKGKMAVVNYDLLANILVVDYLEITHTHTHTHTHAHTHTHTHIHTHTHTHTPKMKK